MREAITDDASLQMFLKKNSSSLMRNREEISVFVRLLDSLPNLMIKDAVSHTISYFPEKGYIDVWCYMSADKANGSKYLFTYVLDEKRAFEIRQQILLESPDEIAKEERIGENVLVLSNIQPSPNAVYPNRLACYWIDVDGWLIKAEYIHEQDFLRTPTVAEVFKSMEVKETFEWS